MKFTTLHLSHSPSVIFVDCAAIYLLYARLEEEHGLARHAMEIYDRATRAVQPEDQYEVFNYQHFVL